MNETFGSPRADVLQYVDLVVVGDEGEKTLKEYEVFSLNTFLGKLMVCSPDCGEMYGQGYEDTEICAFDEGQGICNVEQQQKTMCGKSCAVIFVFYQGRLWRAPDVLR